MLINSGPGTQDEGEACGNYFDARTDFDCGKCIDGLECVKAPELELVTGKRRKKRQSFIDVPSKCSKPNILTIPSSSAFTTSSELDSLTLTPNSVVLVQGIKQI